MSILGYSASYFLPQYWVNTPLYGEKIIPLLDYILSTDYTHTDKLATAFYNIESKYSNTSDLPIGAIEEVIEEGGYGYVRNLLGEDEDSLKLLVYLLVLIHQLKGSERGIQTVLSLLRTSGDELELSFVGNPEVTPSKEVSGFSVNDFVTYSNFTVGVDPFEISFQIKTGDFSEEQCISSCSDYGYYLGINTSGRLVLKLGSQVNGTRGWQNLNEGEPLVSQKTLLRNTNYNIVLVFSGYDYTVKVSLDNENYSYYFIVDSSTPIEIYSGTIFLGIDKSADTVGQPFKGTISLAPFSVSSNNVIITQWYQSFPVGDENTYDVEAEVDLGLVSSNFFVNFAKFAEKYVYPTLSSFKAKLALTAKVTFLPYVRQRIVYVASNVEPDTNRDYMVKGDDTTGSSYYEVKKELNPSEYQDFTVPS